MTIPTIYANQDYSPNLEDYQDYQAANPSTNLDINKKSLLGAGIGTAASGLLAKHMAGTSALEGHKARTDKRTEKYIANKLSPLSKKLKETMLYNNPKGPASTYSHTTNQGKSLKEHIKRMSIVDPRKVPEYMSAKADHMDATKKLDKYLDRRLNPETLKKVKGNAFKKLLSTWKGKGIVGGALAGGAGLGLYAANKHSNSSPATSDEATHYSSY